MSSFKFLMSLFFLLCLGGFGVSKILNLEEHSTEVDFASEANLGKFNALKIEDKSAIGSLPREELTTVESVGSPAVNDKKDLTGKLQVEDVSYKNSQNRYINQFSKLQSLDFSKTQNDVSSQEGEVNFLAAIADSLSQANLQDQISSPLSDLPDEPWEDILVRDQLVQQFHLGQAVQDKGQSTRENGTLKSAMESDFLKSVSSEIINNQSN